MIFRTEREHKTSTFEIFIVFLRKKSLSFLSQCIRSINKLLSICTYVDYPYRIYDIRCVEQRMCAQKQSHISSLKKKQKKEYHGVFFICVWCVFISYFPHIYSFLSTWVKRYICLTTGAHENMNNASPSYESWIMITESIRRNDDLLRILSFTDYDCETYVDSLVHPALLDLLSSECLNLSNQNVQNIRIKSENPVNQHPINIQHQHQENSNITLIFGLMPCIRYVDRVRRLTALCMEGRYVFFNDSSC